MRGFKKRTGFTLVELSLSLAFISVLSITIVLIINNTISSYKRSLMLSQINTTGMELVEDVRTAVQNSSAKAVINECERYNGAMRTICEDDKARNFVTIKRFADVSGVGEDIPVFGAFCTGGYSYIWNSGYFYANEREIKSNGAELSPALLKYTYYDDDDSNYITNSNFRFLKVKDKDRTICFSAMEKINSGEYSQNPEISNEFEINRIKEEPTVILADDPANQLALYDFSAEIPVSDESGFSTFYSMSFILGTLQGGVNVASNGNFCVAPEDFESGFENFDYCSINKFDFAAQAIGGLNE